MKKFVAALVLAGLMLPAFAQPSFADWDHDHPSPRRGLGHIQHIDSPWHGDIHHFHQYDMNVWRGGHWHHVMHDGRLGWWWQVGDLWYFYPRPIYPYPYPLTPPTVATPVYPREYYYFCGSPPGYYPYVPACAVPWSTVVR